MKAAVLHAPNQPLTIEEVTLEKPKAREVLLRTAFAGLCHSDLHFIEGLYPHPTPCVLGHESAAVVEAVGDGVTYVKPGDHVITCLSVFCGTCPQCVTGHPNLCEDTSICSANDDRFRNWFMCCPPFQLMRWATPGSILTLVSSHRLGWPVMHCGQVPQNTDRQVMTWSPGLT